MRKLSDSLKSRKASLEGYQDGRSDVQVDVPDLGFCYVDLGPEYKKFKKTLIKDYGVDWDSVAFLENSAKSWWGELAIAKIVMLDSKYAKGIGMFQAREGWISSQVMDMVVDGAFDDFKDDQYKFHVLFVGLGLSLDDCESNWVDVRFMEESVSQYDFEEEMDLILDAIGEDASSLSYEQKRDYLEKKKEIYYVGEDTFIMNYSSLYGV